MSEYQWKDVSVVGFDELMEALERADRKGYMPDAVKEAWEGFNWKPAQQEPVACQCAQDVAMPEYRCVGRCQYDTSPPAQQQEPVAWMDRDGDLYANEPDKNWCPPHYPLYTTPPAAQPAPDLQAELEATNRQVEILSDALAESRREVAQLKSQPAPLQEPLTDEHIERIYHRYGGNMINCARAIERAVFAAQRQWVGLTPEEIDTVYRNLPPPVQHWQLARTIEAKLKEKNT